MHLRKLLHYHAQVQNGFDKGESTMRQFSTRFALPFLLFAAVLLAATTSMAEGDPHKAKHVIVIM
jgi:hypothetical protein